MAVLAFLETKGTDRCLHYTGISKAQASYLKDTTDFINFIENTKVKKRTFLVSMDVTSLYTNIPHEEGIATVCRAYDEFHRNNSPMPTKYLREMLTLILKENSFRFNGKDYLQIYGTANFGQVPYSIVIYNDN